MTINRLMQYKGMSRDQLLHAIDRIENHDHCRSCERIVLHNAKEREIHLVAIKEELFCHGTM